MPEWPTTPEPPVRFTTLKGCFISFSSTAATMRAVASVPPPAPHGQITVTGRFGQACALADPNPRVAAAPAAPPAISRSRRVYFDIIVSSESFYNCKHIPASAALHYALVGPSCDELIILGELPISRLGKAGPTTDNFAHATESRHRPRNAVPAELH